MIIADRHYWSTADGRLVETGHLDAEILVYPTGVQLSDDVARQLGLLPDPDGQADDESGDDNDEAQTSDEDSSADDDSGADDEQAGDDESPDEPKQVRRQPNKARRRPANK